MELKERIENTFKFIETILLYGRAGSGKSRSAFEIARKHNIDYIIDDGLLIRVSDGKIIAGVTAKASEDIYEIAKIVLFENLKHKTMVQEKMMDAKRVMIIAPSVITGEDIAQGLGLSLFSLKINIEDYLGCKVTIARENRKQNKHIILGDKIQVENIIRIINQRLQGKYSIISFQDGCTEVLYTCSQ